MKATDKVYEKSNEITSVDYVKFSHKEYKSLLEKCGESTTDRFYYGQNLLNYLCEKYKISRCRLIVRNQAQPTFKGGNGKKLGCYHTGIHLIEIWNLTAKQKKVVSIKVFLDTLLHEFMHHYDVEYLKLGATIHSAGFYKRISDLNMKLAA